MKDDQWHHVYCFAERAHAESGEWFDPRDGVEAIVG